MMGRADAAGTRLDREAECSATNLSYNVLAGMDSVVGYPLENDNVRH